MNDIHPGPPFSELHWRVVIPHASNIDPATWHNVVGQCRSCEQGWLVVIEQHPRTPAWLIWYDAKCNRCDREVACPAGKVLRHSSRHSEMPHGWWSERNKAK